MGITLFTVVAVLWIPMYAYSARITGNHTDDSKYSSALTPLVNSGVIEEGSGFVGQGNGSGHTDHEDHGIHVASWNYKYVEQPFIIALFLLVAGICKLGFHHADFLSSILPESCLLIILGTIVGLILHVSEEDEVFPVYLTPRLFFLFLLPPIILESAYSLHDRVFFDNVGTVLLFAVVGTILNCFIIGGALFLLADVGAMGPLTITIVQCLVFSSLIVAVDPVAVLAIFQEIGVNNVLYFLVFGESLLNDAVTVVLYNTMKAFNVMEEITASQIILGFAAFFTVSLGGLFVGLLFGMLTALITKYTENVRVMEPLAIFVLAYMSYLGAEMFHFSGIISIIACGLMQANYAFHNISQKSYTTVKYFSKMQSATSDCVIFMFLGMTLFRSELIWHTGFVLWSLLLCLAVRFLVVFVLTFIANKVNRLKKIDLEEQFIMAYGGLRGAVCFSLVDLLEPSSIPHKNMFVTSSLAVIFFTVFVQGISIKPLVKFFRISLKEKKSLCIYEEINIHVTDHVMAGIEEILGKKGQYFWREILDYYDAKYLRHVFQRTPSKTDEKIMEMFEKIALRQHFENLSSNKFPEQYVSSILFNDESGSDQEDDVLENFPEDLEYVSENPEILDQELEKYERAKDDYMRRKSRAYSLIPTIRAADKRRESRAFVRQDMRHEHSMDQSYTLPNIIDNPTAEDVRKMLMKNPTDLLHQEKTDKNIKKETRGDILQLLQEKQQRTRRMSMCIGNKYDGIFQGALLQSRLGGMSPLTLSRSKMTSIDEDNSAEAISKDNRKRAMSVFTPSDLDKLKRLRKIRPSFTRSATVACDDNEDHCADDRSPLLRNSRKRPELDLTLSTSSVSDQYALSSPSISRERLHSPLKSKETINSPNSSKEKLGDKPVASPDRNRQRERMGNWRRARTKKAQTFDIPAPLVEDTQEVDSGQIGIIQEESNSSHMSPVKPRYGVGSEEDKPNIVENELSETKAIVEMSSLSLPGDGGGIVRNRSYADAIGQDMIGNDKPNNSDEHIV